MSLEQIINDYFISPIWSKTGYNFINTATYAIIALAAIYFIYREFVQKKKLEMNRQFWAGALAWVLFGSSLRVITDSVDSGILAKTAASSQNIIARIIYPKILELGAFQYGILTVSPGIYIVVAALFLLCVYIERKIKINYWAAGAGLVLAAVNFVILSPTWRFLEYGGLVILVAAIAGFGGAWLLGMRKIELSLVVFAHALDGAATWISIDVFGPAVGIGYFEQHWLSGIIGGFSPLGYGAFFLLKVGFALAAAKLIEGETEGGLKMLAL
ncbi:MAG: DUF63 family protein, partial [Candidatus Micrarchaeota archaeon]